MARSSLDRAAVDQRQQGFTLTEMMVVVAIIGILSAVAIMSFNRYSVKARLSEGYAMLGQIKAREEIYRAEFNQFAGAAYHPAAAPLPAATQDWGTGAAVPPEWQQIGVRPDRDLYFVYQVASGPPGGTTIALDAATGGTTPGYPLANDFWFVASARADIDGDGSANYFEFCDRCRGVWVGRTIVDFEGE